MHFLTLDLKKELITSERTFRRNLCRIVVYNVLQSKVEINFFLTFCTTQNFLQPEQNKLFYENFLQY